MANIKLKNSQGVATVYEGIDTLKMTDDTDHKVFFKVDYTQYNITYNLATESHSSSSDTTVNSNGTYTTTISYDSGYTKDSIVVAMGGTDISSTAVSGNVITVASPTGDIVVSVTTKEQTGYNLSFNESNLTSGYIYSLNDSGEWSEYQPAGESMTLTNVTNLKVSFQQGCYTYHSVKWYVNGVSQGLLPNHFSTDNPDINFTTTSDTIITFDSSGTCLAPETFVLTDNGYKRMDEINIGTVLMTYNVDTKQNEYNKVVDWWHHQSNDLVTVNDLFTMTGDHPIYINDYEVVKGREVKVGDYLIDMNGNKVLVKSVSYSTEPIEVYMVEVEGNHNFYITEKTLLSHNY